MDDVSVELADYGKWLAVSVCAPYFLFEADSREEAERLAQHALDFHAELNATGNGWTFRGGN